MRATNWLNRLATAAVMGLCLGVMGSQLTGCEEGPAEEAGEDIDEAVEEAEEELDDVGDEIDDAIDDADGGG